MAYWLFKSEPGTWSWDNQVKAGPKGDEWDGVRNHTAKLNMLAMQPGDRGFFYHSVDEKQIVGTVKVVSEPHQDSTDKTGTWFCVDIAADSPLPRPVSLAEIKVEPRLAEMALVKQSRLSVQPVTDQEWEIISTMAATKKATATATKTAAKPQTKTAGKTTAKSTTKTASAAKAPAKSTAKAPAKTAAKTTAAKTSSKTATAKAPAKTAAKSTAKTSAKAAPKAAAAKAEPKKAAKSEAKPAAKKPASKAAKK